MGFRDQEIAEYDRQFHKEEEASDIEMFVEAYPRATGEILTIDDIDDAPDVIAVD